MKITNNKAAVLAIMLMLLSLACNTMIYQKASVRITGKATDEGYVTICLNNRPSLGEFPDDLTLREGEAFFISFPTLICISPI